PPLRFNGVVAAKRPGAAFTESSSNNVPVLLTVIEVLLTRLPPVPDSASVPPLMVTADPYAALLAVIAKVPDPAIVRAAPVSWPAKVVVLLTNRFAAAAAVIGFVNVRLPVPPKVTCPVAALFRVTLLPVVSCMVSVPLPGRGFAAN